MPILQQIKQDAEFLRNLISTLKVGCTTVKQNGVWLSGQALEEALESARASNRVELQRLELILESGVIPEKYHSIITRKDYTPSDEERKKCRSLCHQQNIHFLPLNQKEKIQIKNYRLSPW